MIEAGAIFPQPTGQCTYFCPSGYFGNKTTTMCETCPAGCQYCTGELYRHTAVCDQCENYAIFNQVTY